MYKCLKREPSNENLTEMTLSRDQPLKISQEIDRMDTAWEKCTESGVLYQLSYVYPAIDFVTDGFKEVYQSTVSTEHFIHLKTIIEICTHVKNQDPNAKVNFFFAVSHAAYDKWGSGWQSFDIGDDQQRAFEELSADEQEALGNLEQYVVSCTEIFNDETPTEE